MSKPSESLVRGVTTQSAVNPKKRPKGESHALPSNNATQAAKKPAKNGNKSDDGVAAGKNQKKSTGLNEMTSNRQVAHPHGKNTTGTGQSRSTNANSNHQSIHHASRDRGKARRPKHPPRATDPRIIRGSYTLENDPFASILRCRSHLPDARPRLLTWHGDCPRYTNEQEHGLRALLLLDAEQERGMMLHQPPERLEAITRACHELGVPLGVALSLRRHCIKWHHPELRMQDLDLGKDEKIRKSAEWFECAVGDYLDKNNIPSYNEWQQRRAIRNATPYPPTPDYIMHYPVRLRRVRKNSNGIDNSYRHEVVDEYDIHWLEAKMYYGASTVPCDDARCANGTLLPTAEKYVRVFGPGAIIFMQGCGRELAERLLAVGVVALDGSTGNIDLHKVHKHQRTWCGNEEGLILP